MTLRIVGAGLGRTGTSSLRVGVEQLLGGRCYHMSQVMLRPTDVTTWRDLAENNVEPDWVRTFAEFDATLDWPAAAYWEQIAQAHPDAFVLLSTRESSDAWYESFSRTIVPVLLEQTAVKHPALEMARVVTFKTFTPNVTDAAECKRLYDAHNAHVRATVSPDRLIDWQPGDGWGPICKALQLDVPTDGFPRVNTSDEFRDMFGLDGGPPTALAGRTAASRGLEHQARRVLRRVKRLLR